MYELMFTGVLLTVGYLFGSHAEKKHYRSIIEREEALNDLPAIASRMPPRDAQRHHQLVMGSVVIANDYFKVFVAGLRNFFGGRVTSYETLLDRARREAVLRMKAEARTLGADYVFNIKYETASISRGGKRSMKVIEVLAYGTALIGSKTDLKI